LRRKQFRLHSSSNAPFFPCSFGTKTEVRGNNLSCFPDSLLSIGFPPPLLPPRSLWKVFYSLTFARRSEVVLPRFFFVTFSPYSIPHRLRASSSFLTFFPLRHPLLSPHRCRVREMRSPPRQCCFWNAAPFLIGLLGSPHDRSCSLFPHSPLPSFDRWTVLPISIPMVFPSPKRSLFFFHPPLWSIR